MVSCVWPFVVRLVNLVEVAVAELEVLLEFGNVCVVGLVVVRGWRGLCCVAVRFWL